MSWLGKAIGGTVGFALGGPIGAVAGAVFGHMFDSDEQKPRMIADRGGGSPGERAEIAEACEIWKLFIYTGGATN